MDIMDEDEFRRRRKERHPQLRIKPCELPQNQLPTTGQVLGNVLYVRLKKMRDKKVGLLSCRISHKECFTVVGREVINLWGKTSIPTKNLSGVRRDMVNLWSKSRSMCKRKQKMSDLPVNHRNRIDMSSLFDISKKSASPEHEEDRAFLEDQRGPRKLKIAA